MTPQQEAERIVKEHWAEKDAKRYAGDWRARSLVTKQAWRKRNGYPKYGTVLQRRTRWRTQYALRAGHLKRIPCQECGSVKSQAHHPDYTKPYDVEFLCSQHHRAVHTTIRAGVGG